jgi:hypothetical protein
MNRHEIYSLPPSVREHFLAITADNSNARPILPGFKDISMSRSKLTRSTLPPEPIWRSVGPDFVKKSSVLGLASDRIRRRAVAWPGRPAVARREGCSLSR